MSWERILPEDDDRFYRENITLLEERVVESFPEWSRQPAILTALRNVPRHLFVNQGYKSLAYTDNALPTCGDLTTSAPSVIARMIHSCGIASGERLLEIGTGTGYQAAILSDMGVKVFTIEIDGPAVHAADKVLVRLGYKIDRRAKGAPGKGDAWQRYRAISRQFPRRKPITLYWGNGQGGLADRAPFKGIIVAASIPHLRHVWQLTAQLSPSGGRMVVPVGDRIEQSLVIVERNGEAVRVSTVGGVSFSFLRMVLGNRDAGEARVPSSGGPVGAR